VSVRASSVFPDGLEEEEKMLKWTHPATSDLVLDRLKKILGVNEKGEVTLGWAPGVFESLAELLSGYISYSGDLSPARRASITERVLIEATRASDFTPKSILDRAADMQTEFLRSPLQPYVMLSSASIAYDDYLKPVSLNGATISFLPQRPAEFARIQNQGRDVEAKFPLRQTHITVAVSARDPIEAAEVAFERQLLWRGIWNLFLNRRTAVRISFGGGGRRPVSRIVPGPLHTVHHPDGKLALEGRWWHSPGLEDVRPESLGASYEPLKKFETWVGDRLKTASIGPDLTRLLTLYCGACDEPELSSGYLALWTVLERITGTDKKSYDDLLRRASFLSHDPPLDRAVLEHLRNQRNGMVHHGSSIDDPERLVYQVKRYVEFALIFLIRNARRFRTMEDFRQLLDLPPDPKLLAERLKLHRWAHGMREKWRKAAESAE
jgi:hypothetical protein